MHRGDPGAKRGDLFGKAVGGILKGSVVLGKEFSYLSENGLCELL